MFAASNRLTAGRLEKERRRSRPIATRSSLSGRPSIRTDRWLYVGAMENDRLHIIPTLAPGSHHSRVVPTELAVANLPVLTFLRWLCTSSNVGHVPRFLRTRRI